MAGVTGRLGSMRLVLSLLLVSFWLTAGAAPARTSSSPTKPVAARVREDLGRLLSDLSYNSKQVVCGVKVFRWCASLNVSHPPTPSDFERIASLAADVGGGKAFPPMTGKDAKILAYHSLLLVDQMLATVASYEEGKRAAAFLEERQLPPGPASAALLPLLVGLLVIIVLLLGMMTALLIYIIVSLKSRTMTDALPPAVVELVARLVFEMLGSVDSRNFNVSRTPGTRLLASEHLPGFMSPVCVSRVPAARSPAPAAASVAVRSEEGGERGGAAFGDGTGEDDSDRMRARLHTAMTKSIASGQLHQQLKAHKWSGQLQPAYFKYLVPGIQEGPTRNVTLATGADPSTSFSGPGTSRRRPSPLCLYSPPPSPRTPVAVKNFFSTHALDSDKAAGSDRPAPPSPVVNAVMDDMSPGHDLWMLFAGDGDEHEDDEKCDFYSEELDRVVAAVDLERMEPEEPLLDLKAPAATAATADHSTTASPLQLAIGTTTGVAHEMVNEPAVVFVPKVVPSPTAAATSATATSGPEASPLLSSSSAACALIAPPSTPVTRHREQDPVLLSFVAEESKQSNRTGGWVYTPPPAARGPSTCRPTVATSSCARGPRRAATPAASVARAGPAATVPRRADRRTATPPGASPTHLSDGIGLMPVSSPPLRFA